MAVRLFFVIILLLKIVFVCAQEFPNQLFGQAYSGSFHLGPVDFTESEFTNGCGPYPSEIQDLESVPSTYLAGVSNNYAASGEMCDVCIYVQTNQGSTAIARVITYGATSQAGDIDISPEMYDYINEGEYPRSMNWQLSSCSVNSTGPITYQFQTEANQWWTSFWVRNAWLPVTNVEVISTNHDSWYELTRGSDGTWTDNVGFGAGSFTLRVTAINDAQIEDTFGFFLPGGLLTSPSGNFEPTIESSSSRVHSSSTIPSSVDTSVPSFIKSSTFGSSSSVLQTADSSISQSDFFSGQDTSSSIPDTYSSVLHSSSTAYSSTASQSDFSSVQESSSSIADFSSGQESASSIADFSNGQESSSSTIDFSSGQESASSTIDFSNDQELSSSTFDSSSNVLSATSNSCATGCPSSRVGNEVCDEACNVEECRYDLGDCNLDSSSVLVPSMLAIFLALSSILFSSNSL